MKRAKSEPPQTSALGAVSRGLRRVEQRIEASEHALHGAIEAVPAAQRQSARNLIHYLALRRHDLRELQRGLSRLGLSSLGRSESWVLGSVREVSERALEALEARAVPRAARELARLVSERSVALTWAQAQEALHAHTVQLLGERPSGRHVYIMVTAPPAKEGDLAWMKKLLRAGMNVLRINCAHEGVPEWTRLIAALAAARRALGLQCRVLMDLAGPKIRTGPVEGGRRIATWKPTKDELGAVTAPAQVWLGAKGEQAGAQPPQLMLSQVEFDTLRIGDELHLRDARQQRRVLTVASIEPGRILCHAVKRAYLLERVRASVRRRGAHLGHVQLEVAGAVDGALDVQAGDPLVLSQGRNPGRQPRRDGKGGVAAPGRISCTLPAALEHLAKGHRVLFDDGLIETVVEAIGPGKGESLLRVVRTQKQHAKLRAEKGINLPDTPLDLPGLTRDDLRALEFVCKHADAVSLSFVRRLADLRALHRHLDRLGRPRLGVVLKIETREGFDNLPLLLLEGLRRPPLAVMIARGDLAVEVGFERVAELQEEILWLCEAAHVPAIWATQVLDTMARTGVPSRAEVTDAAESVAAECVMLNKGPFIDEAVRALADILKRMERHRYKKRSLFPRLKVSGLGLAVKTAGARHGGRSR
jgi:pyruvate kinase